MYVCSSGGKTPDPKMRTFTDIMMENKLRQEEVSCCRSYLVLLFIVHSLNRNTCFVAKSSNIAITPMTSLQLSINQLYNDMSLKGFPLNVEGALPYPLYVMLLAMIV